MNGKPVGPLWTVQEAERALAAILAERDRISDSLMTLEASATRQLLDSTTASGVTAARWAQAQKTYAQLWAWFTAYTGVVDQARLVRGRRSHPEQADLAELARLLTGESVELASTVPQQRTLSGVAAGPQRITLAALVDRMNAAYAEVAEFTGKVDAVWAALLPRLDHTEQAHRAAITLAQELEPAAVAQLSGISVQLDDLRLALISDPLSVHAQPLNVIDTTVANVVSWIERSASIRNEFPARASELAALVGEVRQIEADTAGLRERAVSRIGGVAIPAATTAAALLAQRLSGLDATFSAGLWSQLASDVDGLQADARQALDAARAAAGQIGAPLVLRDELRGRLEAYRVKANALGYAEDATVSAIYARARQLLWSAPCDIGAAAAAVDDYQRHITGRSTQS